jgi:GLPGLI family protein
MLMGGMVGNNAILTNLDELDAQKATEKPSYTVELIDEKKTIADYSCSKAILTDEDGNEMVFWYTDQIEISKKGQNYLYEDVPGFPMEYVINNKGLKMAMTVTKIDQKLDKKSADLFDMKIPSGYKEMTLEDLKKLGMGGM